MILMLLQKLWQNWKPTSLGSESWLKLLARLFLGKMNRQYSWNVCFMLPVYCFLPPSFWVPFPASHSPLMHSSHTKYVCITATSSHQTRLEIIFFIFHFISFHALFHMLYFHALVHISSVFHALFHTWWTSCEPFSNYFSTFYIQ